MFGEGPWLPAASLSAAAAFCHRTRFIAPIAEYAQQVIRINGLVLVSVAEPARHVWRVGYSRFQDVATGSPMGMGFQSLQDAG